MSKSEEIKGSMEPENEEASVKTGEHGSRKRKKNKKAIITAVVVIAIAVIAVIMWLVLRKKTSVTAAATVKTTTVTKGDLTSEISSSGTITAKNSYSITSLATGKIVEADFEEGDMVKKGQVLYRIDATSAETELKNAKNSYERAQANYEDAVKELEEATALYEGGVYRATREGYIKKLYIAAGDKVSGNTQLADIYSESSMKIKVPFLSTDAAQIGAGNDAVLTLSDTLEQVAGRVETVSGMTEAIEGGRLVRQVTIRVANPGGLAVGLTASASVGGLVSAESGTFEAAVDTRMSAELQTQTEVAEVLVHEGDYVSAGTPVFRMTEASYEKVIRNYSDAVDQASEKLDSAENKYDQAEESAGNYTITAPVAGKIIRKNYKEGDKITSSGGMASTLCEMYDMSVYVFEMSVDELDVLNVKEGLSVRIEADAFSGQTFSGKVTNVSLVSSSQNGVSTYPVTVTLDDTWSLLPGMNVDGYIILGESKDTLLVSADAIMRGNQVYVKDDTVTEKTGVVPAGFRAAQVETGLSNEDYVEIKSGVSEGDVVYLPDTSSAVTFQMPGGFGGFGNMDGTVPGAAGGFSGGSDRSSGKSGGFPGGSSGGFSGGGSGGFPGGGRP